MILCTFQAQYHCDRERERERERDIKRYQTELPIMGYPVNDQTKAKAPNWIVASTPTLISLLPSIPKSTNNGWLLLIIIRGILPNYHGIPIHNYQGLTHLCPPDDACREVGISSTPPSPAIPSSFLRTSAVSFMWCVCVRTCSVWVMCTCACEYHQLLGIPCLEKLGVTQNHIIGDGKFS